VRRESLALIRSSRRDFWSAQRPIDPTGGKFFAAAARRAAPRFIASSRTAWAAPTCAERARQARASIEEMPVRRAFLLMRLKLQSRCATKDARRSAHARTSEWSGDHAWRRSIVVHRSLSGFAVFFVVL